MSTMILEGNVTRQEAALELRRWRILAVAAVLTAVFMGGLLAGRVGAPPASADRTLTLRLESVRLPALEPKETEAMK